MKNGKGAIKDRDQVYNSKTGRWIKRDENKKFMSVKSDGEPYKSVRKK